MLGMENKGQVTIHIEGSYGSEPLTPDNYDITLMQNVLGYAIALLDLDKKERDSHNNLSCRKRIS